MNKSVKAALFSAFIFPGLGQILIGHEKRGWIILGVNSVFLCLIIYKIVQQVNFVIFEIQRTGKLIDFETILNMTSTITSYSDNTFLNTMLVLFLVGWVASIIDAYILGNK